MKIGQLLIVLITLCSWQLNAAVLTGKVTNDRGEALAFANVYINGTSKGTTTNEEGFYQLDLPTGTHEVVYLYIGYKKHVEEIAISDGQSINKNVVLESENITLQEVVVTGDEDPAYPIIRKAIDTRKEHYDQVKVFKSLAYVKGLQRIVSAPDKVFGQVVNFDGSLDSNNSGIVYLSESVSELTFKKPDDVKEVMISSKVSGNSQGFSWNRAADFAAFDFYTSTQRIDFLSERVFISPIADNAFMYYKYRLEGFFEEDGRIINKIEVIPKRSSAPAYRGYIYIVENEWVIHSLELTLVKESGINYLDTLNFNYRYIPVDSNKWMPLSQRFSFNFNILNIKAEGFFVSIYKDYELNPDLEKKTFTNEVLTISQESNDRDSAYWETVRPVPLTDEEVADYERKDSLEELRESKSYQDSLSRIANKPGLFDFIRGYTYRNYYKKLSIEFTAPIAITQFNTMEGWNVRFGANIWKEFDERKLLNIEPLLRYGIDNKHFNAKLKVRYFYNRSRFGYIDVEGGQYVFQFNRAEPLSELMNTFYTLFTERNFMKAYEERYIDVTHRIEVFNGFLFWGTVHFGRRYNLNNIPVAKPVDREEFMYTPNEPANPEYELGNLGDHNDASFTIQLRYRPGQKYISRPDQKIFLDSKWPVFSLTYKKAIPGIFNSVTDYDLLEVGLRHDIKMGIFGTTTYIGRGGGFIRNNTVAFQDFKHFNDNQTIFGIHNLDGFQILDYYSASTNDWFAEAHMEHHFDGFFFNKIPGVRKLKLQTVFGVHFLYTPEYKDHTEISVGIENILKVIRTDFVTSFDSRGTNFAFRLGITFSNF